ncbi:hypothetical protein [Thermomonas paludicola]|uniref:hypothetical protein n=1 Tax=Thermomonas paludicola TaxID=2884874 RepID=UPI0021155690|nr:hypothetical protein [Thermomonas paludicola]
MARDRKELIAVTWKKPSLRCGHCGEPMPWPMTGQAKRYCGDRCRQRACRERKSESLA